MVWGNAPARLIALLLSTVPSALVASEPPAPAPIRFELERPEVRVGESMTVSVFLRGERGGPMDGDLRLVCDFGRVGPVERVAKGSYRATLTAPQALPATRTLLLLAQAGAATGELEVPVVPGPPAVLEVSGPRAVLADGRRVELRVSVRDAFGNPADATPLAHAAEGELEAPRRVDRGLWLLGYRPRRVRERVEERIALEAGGVHESWKLRVDPRGAWFGVSAWSGAASSGGSTRLALGAGVGRWWRDERDELGILLDAGWWRLHERTTVALPGGVAELESDRDHLPATLSFSWGHRFGRWIAGWIAAGGGATLISSSQRLTGQARIEEARWTPTATASAAVGARALGGLLFLELRGLWIGDPDLATVAGASRALLVLGGYRFDAR